jgi:spore maturation protein CgeB
MGRAFLDTITSQFLWQNELEPMVVVAAKLLLEQRKSPVRFIIEEACRKTGIEFPFADDKNSTWLCSYIIHTASMLLRRELITACLPLGIRTFGDPEGWKALIGNAAPTWPDIDYRNEIGRIYRAIDININITSCQMPTAVNQRVFDVPLCDGFIINDHQPDLDELFASDETVMYRSKEELIAKIGFFSAHETERAAIAQKARTRVLAQHTYSHRIASLRSMLCR